MHLKYHHITKLFHLKSQLKNLYEHVMVQAFAVSLLSIFIPIHLLLQGYSLQMVFLFLLIQWASFGLFGPLTGKLITRVGIKEILLLRTFLFVPGLIMVAFINALPLTMFFVAAILIGFSSGLYTLSITSLFAHYVDKKKSGNEVGALVALPNLVSIIGPGIGGAIAGLFGFFSLVAITSSLLLISLIPIMRINHNVDHPKFNGIARHFSLKTSLQLFLYGLKSFTLFILVPIILYLFNANLTQLGILASAISLFAVFATYFYGRILDNHPTKGYIRIGSYVSFVFIGLFGLLYEHNFIILLTLFSSTVGLLLDLPIEKTLFINAKKDPLGLMVYKEFVLFLGRVPFFLMLIFFASQIEFGLYMGAVAAFLLQFVF